MFPRPPHPESTSRRDWLMRAGHGFGAVALAALLAGDRPARPARAAGEFGEPPRVDPIQPLSARLPHFVPRAKNVIFLFMYGGVSQVDTLDYKPELLKLHGKPVPKSLKEKSDKVGGVFNACKDELLAGPWKWAQHGSCGRWVSELLPHTARHVDDLCVLRAMHCDSSNHAPATFQMNTGAILAGRPSLGAWTTYGLGSENQNLPGYVLLYKTGGLGGSANWGNAFLPAAFQGTTFRHEGTPVLDLSPPPELAGVQRGTLDLMRQLNRRHQEQRPGVLDLEGRIASYELAYRMQSEALDVGDLARETLATQGAYGIHRAGHAGKWARMCLLSRRLVERGVRFVQLYNAEDKLGWDAHSDVVENHRRNADQTEQAIGALLDDLKARGLFESTLVICAGEFGRTPMAQGNAGRNHNPYGFTLWMAGGGVRGGQARGETDAIGLRAEVDAQPVKNLHATILAALGLDHEKLFFEHDGRPERLTGVLGSSQVIPGVLG